MAPRRALAPSAGAKDGDLTVRARGVTWTAVSGAFACETARGRRVEIRGLELHLLEWGLVAPSGVLLLHGGAAHSHWFDAVAAALAERHHVAAVDQRGHGDSAWATPPGVQHRGLRGRHLGVIDRSGGTRWPSSATRWAATTRSPARRGIPDRSGPWSSRTSARQSPPSGSPRCTSAGATPPPPPHPRGRGGHLPPPAAPDEGGPRPARPRGPRERRAAGRPVSLRFDPACYAARPRWTPGRSCRDQGADAGRPGRTDPRPPPPHGRAPAGRLPAAGASRNRARIHHLVLDRPEAFARSSGASWMLAAPGGRAASARPPGGPVTEPRLEIEQPAAQGLRRHRPRVDPRNLRDLGSVPGGGERYPRSPLPGGLEPRDAEAISERRGHPP